MSRNSNPNDFSYGRKTAPRRTATVVRIDLRDPDEQHDDLHAPMCPKDPVIAEVTGLIRRAGLELANGDLKAANRTLGRARDLCDTELAHA